MPARPGICWITWRVCIGDHGAILAHDTAEHDLVGLSQRNRSHDAAPSDGILGFCQG
jgi:hypothetical protein